MKAKLSVVVIAALSLVGLAEVRGDIYTFNGLPGGDFSDPAFASGKPAQSYAGIGAWTYYESANATASIQGTGDARHAELSVAWYPNGATMWYTSTTSSAADDNWKVSADLKVTPGGDYGYANRKFGIGPDQNNMNFYVDFRCRTSTAVAPHLIEWKAGSQTGSITSYTSIVGDFKNVSIEYDGATGAAKAYFGNELIFDVTTETGLICDTVVFANTTDTGRWDNGTFFIDNVVAVPEPMTLGLLAVGGVFALKRKR